MDNNPYPLTSTPPYGRRRDRPDTEPARDRISTRAMVRVPTRFDVRTRLPAHESVVLLRMESRRGPRRACRRERPVPRGCRVTPSACFGCAARHAMGSLPRGDFRHRHTLRRRARF
jgi:hypothetical protein